MLNYKQTVIISDEFWHIMAAMTSLKRWLACGKVLLLFWTDLDEHEPSPTPWQRIPLELTKRPTWKGDGCKMSCLLYFFLPTVRPEGNVCPFCVLPATASSLVPSALVPCGMVAGTKVAACQSVASFSSLYQDGVVLFLFWSKSVLSQS